jgi:hypothetical protein
MTEELAKQLELKLKLFDSFISRVLDLNFG